MMESVWVYVVGPIIGALAGCISTILFLPQIKQQKIIENQAKAIENEVKQADEWKKLYEEEKALRQDEFKSWSEERNHLLAKIEDLYDRITQHRDEKGKMATRITELEINNTRLSMLKCEVVNCPNRKPPTGY